MKKILFALFPLLLSLPTYASENFIGASFASAFGYPDSTKTIPHTLIALGAPSASAQQNAGSLGGGIYLGRWFTEIVGWEFGYNYLGSGIDGSFKAAPLTGSYNYSVSTFHWALLGGTKVGSGKLFGKAGLYSAKTKSELTVSGFGTTSSSESNLGLLLGVGFEEPLSKNLSTKFAIDAFNGVKFYEIGNDTFVNQTMFRISFGLDLKY